MADLNEHQKRKILTSLQHSDKVLEECLRIPTPSARPLFPANLQDVSSAEYHWIESYVEKIRDQFADLLRRFEIEPQPPSVRSSWALQTNLISLDITLEDLNPERLRGYGTLDPETSQELSWALGEVRRLVSQLLAFLSRGRGLEGLRLTHRSFESLPDGLMERLARIISRHGLVEFLPALRSIVRKVESHRFEIAVFGRVSSGKSSLINRLLGTNLLPVGTTPITAVPTHILSGRAPGLRIHLADQVQELPLEKLPEFATEQKNPSNLKRVVRIEVSIPSDRIPAEVAFVDTPGIASLATSGTRLSYAYLPESDLGLVLIDGHSAVGREDVELLRALRIVGIPSVVLVSKCDLLSDEDVARVCGYTKDSLAEHLGFAPDVVPVSSADSWSERVNSWFQQSISPLLHRSRESLAASVDRKVHSLCESLLATLKMKSGRSGSATADDRELESMLRPLDENIADLDERWRDAFDTLSPWLDEILDQAASGMATASMEPADEARAYEVCLERVVIDAAASHCSAFVEEYEQLAGRIGRLLADLKNTGRVPRAEERHGPPRPSALPSPAVSMLEGISISAPGALARISTAGRERHFRRELEEKAGAAVQKILEELRPRLRHWLSSMKRALEEDYRTQTDPLRYRNSGRDLALTDQQTEELRADISLLLGQPEKEEDRIPT
jgi:GTP-binding protein EngB required for normal cell division